MLTRIAPTPSGFLHEGNAVNALVTSWWATQDDLTVALRLDDLDGPRIRQEYVDDVFEVLTWLGIHWSVGPTDAHESVPQRVRRVEECRSALEDARAADLPAYACACSRRMLIKPPTGGCPGGCRSLDLALDPGRTALRVAVPVGTMVQVENESIPVDRVLGDFVIWRRDDLPAYQWSSLVEDTAMGTTHILRGDDLRPSTAAQLFLAGFLPDSSLGEATIRHHSLLTDANGAKLSKSQLRTVSGLPRTPSMREHLEELAAGIASPLGIRTPH